MKRKRLALFVMIDALGSRYLQNNDFLTELPYRGSLRAVLGFSCACQPTLLSGVDPHEHGHGPMYRRRQGPSVLDPARAYGWLPSRIADNHRVRQRIYGKVSAQVDGYFSLYECPTRLLPEFDLVEKKTIFRPGGLRNHHSIFDRLTELDLEYRSYYWDRSEEENLLATESDIKGGEVDFIFLYLPRLDGFLHAEGSDGQTVRDHLSWYEGWLLRLQALAHEAAEEVDFFVFSDHGMTDVHGSADLITPVEAQFGRNGDRYLAFYDSTMARFWSDDAATRDEIEAFLQGRPEGRIIPPDELKELGVGFEDRSQGDVVFALHEGLILVPSYMGRSMLAGMHGYHPDAKDASACLLGERPPSRDMSHIRDLFFLMEDAALELVRARA